MKKQELIEDFANDLENYITKTEPAIIELDGPMKQYVQAIIGTDGDICVEIAGPMFLAMKPTQEQIDELVSRGWGLPDPEYSPNFWRSYPAGTDGLLIAKQAITDAIQVLNAKPSASGGLDPMFPNLEEAEELMRQNQEFWAQERAALAALTHFDQDFAEILVMCESCKAIFKLGEANQNLEGLIVELNCPQCSSRIVNLATEQIK